MAASLNRVFIMGNLTRDPELRYIPSGQAVASFSVAVNRVYNTPSGEKKEEVSFINVVAWGRRAEVCGEYLSKGSPVFVEGRLQSRSWEDKNGAKRYALEVIASNVQFLRMGPKAGSSPAAPARTISAPEEVESIDLGADTASSPPDADPSAEKSDNGFRKHFGDAEDKNKKGSGEVPF